MNWKIILEDFFVCFLVIIVILCITFLGYILATESCYGYAKLFLWFCMGLGLTDKYLLVYVFGEKLVEELNKEMFIKKIKIKRKENIIKETINFQRRLSTPIRIDVFGSGV